MKHRLQTWLQVATDDFLGHAIRDRWNTQRARAATDFGWRRSSRYVTDLQVPMSRILEGKVAGSGVTDLQGWWWFWSLW